MSIIKFRKVPELFPNRKVRTVHTEQLCAKCCKVINKSAIDIAIDLNAIVTTFGIFVWAVNGRSILTEQLLKMLPVSFDIDVDVQSCHWSMTSSTIRCCLVHSVGLYHTAMHRASFQIFYVVADSGVWKGHGSLHFLLHDIPHLTMDCLRLDARITELRHCASKNRHGITSTVSGEMSCWKTA